jgi:hypothetical protein
VLGKVTFELRGRRTERRVAGHVRLASSDAVKGLAYFSGGTTVSPGSCGTNTNFGGGFLVAEPLRRGQNVPRPPPQGLRCTPTGKTATACDFVLHFLSAALRKSPNRPVLIDQSSSIKLRVTGICHVTPRQSPNPAVGTFGTKSSNTVCGAIRSVARQTRPMEATTTIRLPAMKRPQSSPQGQKARINQLPLSYKKRPSRRKGSTFSRVNLPACRFTVLEAGLVMVK